RACSGCGPPRRRPRRGWTRLSIAASGPSGSWPTRPRTRTPHGRCWPRRSARCRRPTPRRPRPPAGSGRRPGARGAPRARGGGPAGGGGEKDRAQVGDVGGKLAVQEAEGPVGRLAAGEADPGEEAGAAAKNALAAEAMAARNAEMEARLEVRTVEERLRA